MQVTFLKSIVAAGAAAVLASVGAFAQDEDMSEAERVARAYMAAYSAADFDAMEPFMAEDISFSDTTATGTDDPDGLNLEGRAAAMELLHQFEAENHPIGLNFEWDTVFESNNRVVFMGRVNATYPTNEENRVFVWSSAQTSVLTVVDGLVVRHQDFANYPGAEQGLVDADEL